MARASQTGAGTIDADCSNALADSSNAASLSFPLNRRAARGRALRRRAAARARRRRQRQDARHHREDRASRRTRHRRRDASSRSRSRTRRRARCASARRRAPAQAAPRDAASRGLDLDVPRARPVDRARRGARARPQALVSRSSIPPISSRSSPSSPPPPIARARARSQWKISQWKNALVAPADALRVGGRRRRARRGARVRQLRRCASRVPGGRLRRPDRAAGRAVRARRRRRARAGRRAARTCWSTNTRTRIPRSTGCFAHLVGDGDAIHRRRRRRPGDLRLARRDARQPRRAAARLSAACA